MLFRRDEIWGDGKYEVFLLCYDESNFSISILHRQESLQNFSKKNILICVDMSVYFPIQLGNSSVSTLYLS